MIIPMKNKKEGKRKIGLLDGKVKISFSKGFKISEEEFLS
ncbi:toxin-antitoxin system, antitoxin component, PHD family [Leptospira interrogans serovar Grippotyphosa str. UI 08434]|nr:toxin-antitoxin system, antitoxin component, PHD family [Leptospira interrogans serovar Grippotyphosa str. UI 08434]